MSSPLVWKVYGPLVPRSNPHAGKHRLLLAALAHAEDAAAVVALHGEGAVVKHSGFIVWTEGKDGNWAGASYDHAAGAMHDALTMEQRRRFHIAYGMTPEESAAKRAGRDRSRDYAIGSGTERRGLFAYRDGREAQNA